MSQQTTEVAVTIVDAIQINGYPDPVSPVGAFVARYHGILELEIRADGPPTISLTQPHRPDYRWELSVGDVIFADDEGNLWVAAPSVIKESGLAQGK